MIISKWISGASLGLALAAASVAHATPSFPLGATGDWQGALASKDDTRHIFIHIHRTLMGGYVEANASRPLTLKADVANSGASRIIRQR